MPGDTSSAVPIPGSSRDEDAELFHLLRSSHIFASAVRPMRPLYLRHACSAISYSLSGGQPGKNSRNRSEKRFTYCLSNTTLLSASRFLRRSLTSLSDRHSCSACSTAFSSTNKPCRSYLLLARLHFSTTATSVEYFRDRLVSAVSPEGRKIR